MLNSGVLKLDHRAAVAPHPRGQRGDLRDLPAVAVPRLPARSPMSAPRFPAVAAPPRPLRVLLPARGRPGERPLGLDPPHRLQAPRRPGRPARCGARCSTPPSPSRARSSSRCPTRAPATGSSSAPSHIGPDGAARPRRGAGPQRGLGAHASAPPPSRCATSPTPGSTTRRCRGRRRRARCPTRRSPAGSRRTASAGSSTPGPGCSATTGAPSTPSAGSGCTASASTARPTRGSTSRSAASASAASPRRGSPTARCTSTGSGSASAASAGARASTSAPTAASIEVSGVRIEVRAAPLVSWVYSDPSGGEHRSTNCSIAAVELTPWRGGCCAPRTAARGSSGRARRPSGVEVQPFPDP